MQRLLPALILLLVFSGCYGRESPESCHAKHVRDGRGSAGSYERCMTRYRQRHPVAEAADYAVVARAPEVEIARKYAPLLVKAMCTKDELTPPEMLTTNIDRLVIQQRCGLVVVDFMGDRRTGLVAKHCEGNEDDPCKQKLAAMFNARITERYTMTDAAWVANHCTGYPDDCDDDTEIEAHHLRLHNEKIMAAWRADLDHLGAQRAQALATELSAARAAEEQQAAARRRAWVLLGVAVLRRPR